MQDIYDETVNNYENKELTLTDFISVDMLQKIQDAFSEMTGMAALITDRYGVPVTIGSNFTDFCMAYTRQSVIGRSRCEQCDKKGAESAYQSGKPCIYECHAGLMDYGLCCTNQGKWGDDWLLYRRTGFAGEDES